MSQSKKMILRVQTAEGTKRLELFDYDTTSNLFEKIYDCFHLNSFTFALYRDKQHKEEIASSKSKTLRDYLLQHGDMVYVSSLNGAVSFDQPTTSAEGIKKQAGENVQFQPSSSIVPSPSSTSMNEDEVDVLLYKVDGKVQRKRDEKLCRHNSNGSCVHCAPLDPFDDEYLKEQNVKHMSFHAYIRKMMSGVDRGKFIALEDIQCSIKPGCKEHPPWPRGICSKCQPSAVTLNRQVYRHIDNVMFENTDILERFLDYWRSSGNQRIGFLYGQYERHTELPLGVRARVAAIYEPPQSTSRDSITLMPDEHKEAVDEVAEGLGLTRVGWIFTDLLSEDVAKGTVQQNRGIYSHFLSAQECIMAGSFQNQHPNVSKYASSGYFGSKFVTVCVTGDSSKQVHMEGYQVSSQCMALVRENCLLPTKDAPELGYIRESSDKQYVPDVYYKEKDKYGNEVSRVARPLPVEYLLVDVPAAAARAARSTCGRPKAPKQPFPASGRHMQDLPALGRYLQQFTYSDDDFLEAISDFHVLVYLATNAAWAVRGLAARPLLEAVKEGDATAASRWRHECDAWQTLAHLAESAAAEDSPKGHSSNENISSGIMWTCPHCTYHNSPNRDTCEICVLPRGNAM